MAGFTEVEGEFSVDNRLLHGSCLGCNGENLHAQKNIKLSSCLTTHSDKEKQCKHCPNWHHLCLAKLGSENIDKCHWCNSPADLGNPETFTLLLTTYLAVGLSLAKYRTAMDPTDFYMHTNILATRLEKDHKSTFPFTVDPMQKIVLSFPDESFFTDRMQKAFEEGLVIPDQWPQPPTPVISGGEGGSVTESDDVVVLEMAGEENEQAAEDATGVQCAAPTPASSQALAPATDNLRNVDLDQEDIESKEDIQLGDLLAVPAKDGKFKVGRLRRTALIEGETHVAVAIGEDDSPFGCMRVSGYNVLEDLTVASEGGIKGGEVVVHKMAEVKSPSSEKVHTNREWQTFGILDFKLLGNEFFFKHRYTGPI